MDLGGDCCLGFCSPSLFCMRVFFPRVIKMTFLICDFFKKKKSNMKKTFIVNKLYLLNQLS